MWPLAAQSPLKLATLRKAPHPQRGNTEGAVVPDRYLVFCSCQVFLTKQMGVCKQVFLLQSMGHQSNKHYANTLATTLEIQATLGFMHKD